MVQYEGEDILDNILSITPIPKDCDILSIDIDSSDYQVWRSVEKYNPKIVIIEINSSVSPLVEDCIHGKEHETTSFLPMLRLGEEKGYTLICHTGNLIFIRNDLKHVVEDELVPSETCHRTNWLFN